MAEIEIYRNNINLKKIGQAIDFTEFELSEYLKCQQDPLYFIKTYVKIVTKDKGIVPFGEVIHPFQEELIQMLHNERFVISKIFRQAGKTTTVNAYLLYLICFKDNHKIGIVANKEKMAIDIVSRLKFSFEHLPLWIKPGVREWNKSSIELENGSIAMAEATADDTFRGRDINTLYCDEVAWISNNIFTEFYASIYPAISSGLSTKMFMTSTPRGINIFYKLWTDAVAGRNIFKPLEIKWWMVPGRDEQWKESVINGMPDKEQWKIEFECEFLGSSNTLISGEKLSCLAYKDAIDKYCDMDVFEYPIKETTNENGDIISMDHIYVMTVDVAEGKNLDYSAFSIFDVSSFPYRQVAKYRSKSIQPLLFPNLLKLCAEYYNNAHVLIEINCHPAVASTLSIDLEYENVFRVYSGNKQPQKAAISGRNGAYGVKMVHMAKINGCTTLKSLIENDKLIVVDFDTINELSTFISKGKSFQADENCHDDLAITLVLFGWLANQDLFKELTDSDIRKNLEFQQYGDRFLENDLPPVGKVITGLELPFEIEQGDVWMSAEYSYEDYFREWFENV